jgi:methylated-DNA-[protein]-cysteine S-methyltransferase
MSSHAPLTSTGPGGEVLGCAHLDVPGVHARLWLAWSARGLVRVNWETEGAPADTVFGAGHPVPSALPEPYASVFSAYLAGEAVDPAQLPVDFSGTAFQAKVWRALRRIGRGQVRSYAAIAADVGSPRAMRAVGGANGKNPLAIVVPCHRVVEAAMRIGGYTGGLHLKRFLLDLEGVRTVGDIVQPGQLELL